MLIEIAIITVTMAENGLSALKLMKQNISSLVLMDKEMPTMNGVQATRDIRAFEQSIPKKTETFHYMCDSELMRRDSLYPTSLKAVVG